MRTKTKPAHRFSVVTYEDTGTSPFRNVSEYTTGAETITYEDGRKVEGHWPWKRCVHTSNSVYSPVAAEAYSHYEDPPSSKNPRVWNMTGRFCPTLSSLPTLPKGSWDDNCVRAILDQLDLNSKENVLLYSGVIQAVPLLGSVFKLNRILGDAARKFGKDLRKKPFTSAVKTLISADFIDRFVISPTLDDARRFQDATDYVLRVIQTARERNAHKFALQSTTTVVTKETTRTGVRTNRGDFSYLYGTEVTKAYTTSKAFMLLEAKYDMMAVDPIKIWAQRVGLTRPLDSVWDLVPFSFVIDYFTRAGDFISALSDEMSSVEGLKGRITRIHDLWGSVENTASVVWTPTGPCRDPAPSWGYNRQFKYTPLQAKLVSSRYERFQVPRPFVYLSQLQEKLSDYLTISTDLSSTRKRTLLELVIQSRLGRP